MAVSGGAAPQGRRLRSAGAKLGRGARGGELERLLTGCAAGKEELGFYEACRWEGVG